MKEKLSAILTLGFIFSLFFYYKVINPIDENTISTNIDSQVETTSYQSEINDNIVFKDDLIEQDNKIDECTLDLNATNQMVFSSAFKYYRDCNGPSSIFIWNENKYSTILLSEINNDNNNQLNDNRSLVINKKELKVQDYIIGDNSNIE